MILESALILSLANQCQSNISTDIIQKLISIESSGNPYAIAVKGVPIVKQPTTKEEAIQSAKQLQQLGFNFSVGLMQVNHTNFDRTELTIETAFNYCENIKAGSQIFKDCLDRATIKYPNKNESAILEHAASCYYSGNFTYGFKKEGKSNVSYVEKFNGITSNANQPKKPVKQKTENKTPQDSNNTAVWDVFGDFSY